MKRCPWMFLGLVVLAGCWPPKQQTTPSNAADTLVEVRKGFKTKLNPSTANKNPAPQPPYPFQKVRYDSPSGPLVAYVTSSHHDGKRHPAIIWITGGDSNTLDESIWKKSPPSNDQTARAYREAGIVMMFPSLRGGNDNPGVKEGFLGEVDDIVAAAAFLAKMADVDPNRIYLGGHSTGGTLVLLVAECSDRFRAVFSFGPAAAVSGYGPEYLPFDTSDQLEIVVRSPGLWLKSIRNPTFVLEGTERGNLTSLEAMRQLSTNSRIAFVPVRNATHFSILAPVNTMIAEKILRDEGPTCQITITEDEVNQLFVK